MNSTPIENDIVHVVLPQDQENESLDPNIRVHPSVLELKGLVEMGKTYVKYGKYSGLSRTGDTPWIVTKQLGDHQVAHSLHETLDKALQKARSLNQDQ